MLDDKGNMQYNAPTYRLYLGQRYKKTIKNTVYWARGYNDGCKL